MLINLAKSNVRDGEWLDACDTLEDGAMTIMASFIEDTPQESVYLFWEDGVCVGVLAAMVGEYNPLSKDNPKAVAMLTDLRTGKSEQHSIEYVLDADGGYLHTLIDGLIVPTFHLDPA